MINKNDLNHLTFEELDNYVSDDIKIYEAIVSTSNLKLKTGFISKNLKQKNEDSTFFVTTLNKIGKLTRIDDSNNRIEVFNIDIILDIKKNKLKDILEKKAIETGFCDIDKRTIINNGDFIIVASRPTMGKSSFVYNIALNNILNNKKVSIHTLESSRKQVLIKMLSSKTSISCSNIVKNDLNKEHLKILEKAFADIENEYLFIDDYNYTLNRLINKIKRDYIFYGIEIVIIDYIQLIKMTAPLDTRYLELNIISRELKILAKELNIVIIATSELNRNLENRPDKRPMLNDMRDSGTIEEDADLILFVYRDDMYKERDESRKEKEAKDKGEEYKSTFFNKPIEEVEIIISKQRMGPVGTVKIDFEKQCTKFIDKKYNNDAPIEIVFESIANENRETNIEVPNIL